MNVTVVGSGTGTPVNVGPLALDANGRDLCLHLDATQYGNWMFFADSPSVPGTNAAVDIRLESTAYAPIKDGRPLTVGNTAPQTSVELTWPPPAGTTTDVVLWVHATSTTPVTTPLALALMPGLD
jgi:hypothetical protein